MAESTKPVNETERLAALERLAIMDSAREREYDDIVTIAAQICGTPMALISLVDDKRQWFKAALGLSVPQTPRGIAFCAHAIENAGVFIVEDATQDNRFAKNPLVTQDPNLRFYAGAPLLTPDGYAIGTLCVLDRAPRKLSSEQEHALQALSRQVTQLLELRRLNLEQRQEHIKISADFEATNVQLQFNVEERTAERDQRAHDLTRAEEQLRQSQKMEAVGQLTGGIAHDFNNLLAGISGSLELMNMRINQGRLKDLEKYLVAARGATKRASALTHRLLAFSRRQTLDPKATDVNKLVAGMLELLQRTVGPSTQVETVLLAGLWSALVDPSQLENSLLNLCLNARDAMPGGGQITIETGNRWIDRHGGKQYDMPEGQYLSICVSDTGTGMPADVIAKAFDPFFTTKPIGQGTGLGLSMIYGFATQSGGQVRIYSEMGQGTMVCIYLPRHRGVADAHEPAEEVTARPLARAGETVLIVDDEPVVRMLITDVLEDLGYTAIEAGDGAGGLRVLQSNARIDLLISDVGLPGTLNGRQMADAARVNRPDLKVLFITGFAENALLKNGQLEPGMSVLTKPFVIETLTARIRELIAK